MIKKAIKIPILMYHEITDENRIDDISNIIASPWIVTTGDFEKQVRILRDSGYTAVSLSKLLDILQGGSDNNLSYAKPVVITFDDGFAGNYEYGFPLLQKYGMCATFFVTTCNIGKKCMMTWQQLREMSRFDMSVESHTLSHPLLSNLGFDETKKELLESKRIIEGKIGEKVEFISLPNGDFNKYYFEIAADSGYCGGCSSVYGFNSSKTNRYLLRRISMKKNLDVLQFKSLLDSGSLRSMLTFGKSIIKSGISKTIGKKYYDRIYNAFYGVDSQNH